ncbi:receptor protein kinase-like protein ZAR1 [Elaeis guineensis]|uniref:Receptor protein kinase-like protein ZAR1 n=1 Tax=Elaeis guineensis var. tenera TaxID=51953 RepID=A0A6I9RKT5_ELAGV|nr:receptor protein kinase-like protein ZAR1 [Elaeis guineensis]
MVGFSTFVTLLLFLPSLAASLTTDGLALLALKSAISVDPTGALDAWLDSDPDPCGWLGVTCRGGRVTALALSNRSLEGYLPSELSLLSSLQTLSLSHNHLSGPIPTTITALRSLVVLDLSNNNLSGPIPAEIGALGSLSHLDLSSNLLNGSLPPEIAALLQLSGVLNLSCNSFSGQIPPAFGTIPVAVSLDLRQNNLSGEIPQVGSLVNQGPTAFAGNPGLCGFPLKNPCSDGANKQDPNIPLPNPNLNPSSPTSRPIEAEKRLRPAMTVTILAGAVLAAIFSILVLQWQFRRKRAAGELKASTKVKGGSTAVTEHRREGQSEEIYVAVDGRFDLELEELLRASAYVVGKSRSGIVYKVVVGPGSALAVRRLSEAADGEGDGDGDDWRLRRAFESEAAAIGRVSHPNVVSLRAYYYAPDEKLLIYDYVPNGTLQAALHGGQPNPTVPALPWAARLAIVQGVARGLTYLHECGPRKSVHGNIRSSKILLDDELRPYISGFGIARLLSGTQKFTHSGSKKLVAAPGRGPHAAYLAPEARAPGAAATQKGDVYAFGVVVMEVVTGRPAAGCGDGEGELEGWVRRAFGEERPLSEVVDPALLHEVHAKKQVLAVFHVALGCTEPDPEMRPRMRAVVESLDRVGSAR